MLTSEAFEKWCLVAMLVSSSSSDLSWSISSSLSVEYFSLLFSLITGGDRRDLLISFKIW